MTKFIILVLGLSAGAAAQNDNLFKQCIPHIAAGGGWSTTITIYNLRETVAWGTLRFHDQQGRPLMLPVSENALVNVTESIDMAIQPNGSRVIELPDIGAATQIGYAVLTRSTGSLSTMATFRQRVPGRPDFEATLPGSNIVTKRWALLFDNSAGAGTTFAIVNPDPQSADFAFEFFDTSGNRLSREMITLAGGQQQAFSSAGRWASAANRRGTVHVSRVAPGLAGADFGVNVFALRFNATGAFSWIYMEPPALTAIIQVIQGGAPGATVE